ALQKSARALLAEQRANGGWGQLPSMASDAFATGQALVALRESAGIGRVPGPSSGPLIDNCRRVHASHRQPGWRNWRPWSVPYFDRNLSESVTRPPGWSEPDWLWNRLAVVVRYVAVRRVDHLVLRISPLSSHERGSSENGFFSRLFRGCLLLSLLAFCFSGRSSCTTELGGHSPKSKRRVMGAAVVQASGSWEMWSVLWARE